MGLSITRHVIVISEIFFHSHIFNVITWKEKQQQLQMWIIFDGMIRMKKDVIHISFAH